MENQQSSSDSLLTTASLPEFRTVLEIVITFVLCGILIVLIKLYAVYRDAQHPHRNPEIARVTPRSRSLRSIEKDGARQRHLPYKTVAREQGSGYESAKSAALRETLPLIEQDLQPMQKTNPNFPDSLYAKGYISASECEGVAKAPSNLYGHKLGSAIRKLDVPSFLGVLNIIEATPYKHVALAIRDSFMRKKDSVNLKCSICVISEEVDILDFVAQLFQSSLITRKRYDFIINSTQQTSDRKAIWEGIFYDARISKKDIYFFDKLKELLSNSKYKSVYEKLCRNPPALLSCSCTDKFPRVQVKRDNAVVLFPAIESSSDNDSNTTPVPYHHDEKFEEAVRSSSSSEEPYTKTIRNSYWMRENINLTTRKVHVDWQTTPRATDPNSTSSSTTPVSTSRRRNRHRRRSVTKQTPVGRVKPQKSKKRISSGESETELKRLRESDASVINISENRTQTRSISLQRFETDIW